MDEITVIVQPQVTEVTIMVQEPGSIPQQLEQRIYALETTIEQLDGELSGATFTDYYNLAKN